MDPDEAQILRLAQLELALVLNSEAKSIGIRGWMDDLRKRDNSAGFGVFQ